MPSFSVTVPHSLGQAEARTRVDRFLENVQRDYAAHLSDVQGEWLENRLQFGFRASGLPISGQLIVEESEVHVAGPLPLAAALFRGRIERSIHDELQKLLS